MQLTTHIRDTWEEQTHSKETYLLTYSGASAAKTSKSIGKKRNSSALSGTSSATFLQGHDECCDELTTYTWNVVVENKNADQKSPPMVDQVLKEHNYPVDSNEV